MSEKNKWCCEQKRGISLIESSDNLSISYINEADNTLEDVDSLRKKIEERYKK